MAKTNAERQREYRKRVNRTVYEERINLVLDAKKVLVLDRYATYHGITKTAALERMIEGFWKTLPFDERIEIMDHDAVGTAKIDGKPASDTKTIPLPFE